MTPRSSKSWPFIVPLLKESSIKFLWTGESPEWWNAIPFLTHCDNLLHCFVGELSAVRILFSISNNSYLLKLENCKTSSEEIINPNDYGFNKADITKIIGKDPKYNAKQLLELLNGKKSAYRDIVILNSAFALKLARKTQNIEEGIEMANKSIDEGLAFGVLKQCKN